VPDEGHDANEWRDEYEQVQQEVHGVGEPARQYSDFRR